MGKTLNRQEGEENPEIVCACGCGIVFLKYDRYGRPRRFYASGHVRKNVSMSQSTKDKIGNANRGRSSWMKGTGAFDRYTPVDTRYIRRLFNNLKAQNNFICSMCGSHRKGKTLHVHHVDHNPQNNHITNLIVLCSTCHNRLHRKANYIKYISEVLSCPP